MISICIPTYEMDGHGVAFLTRLLGSIRAQSFTDYEIIVSDHSANHDIEVSCAGFPRLNYFRNAEKRGNSSANLNNAMARASGTHIKIIFQDDFLAGPESLSQMAANIGHHGWLVHSYWHTDAAGVSRRDPTRPHIPEPAHELLWRNTIGAPTALLLRNTTLNFDENLIWLMDCAFYYRLWQTSGAPMVMTEPLAVQTLWPGQLTHKISQSVKDWEADYVRRKYLLGEV